MRPDPAHSSYCSHREDECKKKCKAEKDKFIEEAEKMCVGNDIEEEVIAEALCMVDSVDTNMHECHEACAAARRKCNEGHPESVVEDKSERLEGKVNTLENQLHQLEHRHRYLEHEQRRHFEEEKEPSETKP